MIMQHIHRAFFLFLNIIFSCLSTLQAGFPSSTSIMVPATGIARVPQVIEDNHLTKLSKREAMYSVPAQKETFFSVFKNAQDASAYVKDRPFGYSEHYKNFLHQYDIDDTCATREASQVLHELYTVQQHFGHFYEVAHIQNIALVLVRIALATLSNTSLHMPEEPGVESRLKVVKQLLEIACWLSRAAEQIGHYRMTDSQFGWQYTNNALNHVLSNVFMSLDTLSREVISYQTTLPPELAKLIVFPIDLLTNLYKSSDSLTQEITQQCTIALAPLLEEEQYIVEVATASQQPILVVTPLITLTQQINAGIARPIVETPSYIPAPTITQGKPKKYNLRLSIKDAATGVLKKANVPLEHLITGNIIGTGASLSTTVTKQEIIDQIRVYQKALFDLIPRSQSIDTQAAQAFANIAPYWVTASMQSDGCIYATTHYYRLVSYDATTYTWDFMLELIPNMKLDRSHPLVKQLVNETIKEELCYLQDMKQCIERSGNNANRQKRGEYFFKLRAIKQMIKRNIVPPFVASILHNTIPIPAKQDNHFLYISMCDELVIVFDKTHNQILALEDLENIQQLAASSCDIAAMLQDESVLPETHNVPIGQLQPGRCIWGYNLHTQTYSRVAVRAIRINATTQVHTMTTQRGDIIASADQLFYDAATHQLITAAAWTTDCVFLTKDLEPLSTLHVTSSVVPQTDFYELEIDVPHFFFATDLQVLAHNIAPFLLLALPLLIQAAPYLQRAYPLFTNAGTAIVCTGQIAVSYAPVVERAVRTFINTNSVVTCAQQTIANSGPEIAMVARALAWTSNALARVGNAAMRTIATFDQPLKMALSPEVQGTGRWILETYAQQPAPWQQASTHSYQSSAPASISSQHPITKPAAASPAATPRGAVQVMIAKQAITVPPRTSRPLTTPRSMTSHASSTVPETTIRMPVVTPVYLHPDRLILPTNFITYTQTSPTSGTWSYGNAHLSLSFNEIDFEERARRSEQAQEAENALNKHIEEWNEKNSKDVYWYRTQTAEKAKAKGMSFDEFIFTNFEDFQFAGYQDLLRYSLHFVDAMPQLQELFAVRKPLYSLFWDSIRLWSITVGEKFDNAYSIPHGYYFRYKHPSVAITAPGARPLISLTKLVNNLAEEAAQKRAILEQQARDAAVARAAQAAREAAARQKAADEARIAPVKQALLAVQKTEQALVESRKNLYEIHEEIAIPFLAAEPFTLSTVSIENADEVNNSSSSLLRSSDLTSLDVPEALITPSSAVIPAKAGTQRAPSMGAIYRMKVPNNER